jgi:pimeloyl-ACP methyl ester carboxylesterase
MRAGFEVYRAFGQHADDNQATLKRNGKLAMPVLAVGGAMSSAGPFVQEMMNEVAQNVTGLRIPGASHFIPEENPEAFASAVLDFTGSSAST